MLSAFFSALKKGRKAGLLLLAILCSSQPVFGQQLTHGPFVGGVTPASARFYLRVDTVANVNVQLSTTQNFTAVISGNPQTVAAENDFTALIRLDGLAADSLYYYRAVVNGAPDGEVRQFRTFPAFGERAPFLFTFGSCQQNRPWRGSPTAGRVFKMMAGDKPRFFLQIGDWGYPDSTDTDKDSTNFFSVQMSRVQASYRAKYDSIYPLQEVLRLAPMDYVYDDHDYMNNNASAFTSSDGDRAREIPAPPQARLNSIKGYQQLFPGYSLANSNGGIWHKFAFGNAEFFMLDMRSQRSPNMNALRRNSVTGKLEFISNNRRHSILAGDSTLLGENQRDWLLRELRASQADWKFLVSSVPFNRGLRRALDMALSVQDSAITLPGFGRITGAYVAIEILDKWVGFEQEQEMLLQFLRDHGIKNVIALSGDLHTAAIDDGASGGLPEIMAGGLDITNSMIVALLELLDIRIWNRGGQTQIGGSFDDAYGRITVCGADSVRLEVVDEFGKILARHTVLDGSLPSGVSRRAEVVAQFSLLPNYPNPLRPMASDSRTTLRYSLPAAAAITATVYDVLGRRVRQLRKEKQEAGVHTLIWDGTDDRGVALPSGVYLLAITLAYQNGQQQRATQKIALIK